MHSIGGVYGIIGIWIAIFWPVSNLQLVLKPWQSVLVGF